MLSTDKALRLYFLLEDHLPEEVENVLEFIGTIVRSMKENDPDSYLEALGVCLDKTVEEVLEEVNPRESFIVLTEFIFDNNLLLLRDFVRKLQNG
jgi:hypothetical protein